MLHYLLQGKTLITNLLSLLIINTSILINKKQNIRLISFFRVNSLNLRCWSKLNFSPYLYRISITAICRTIKTRSISRSSKITENFSFIAFNSTCSIMCRQFINFYSRFNSLFLCLYILQGQ